MSEREYSVSEAVRLVGVESHVLRYWEEELQADIKRTSQGHRVYSEKNIETFRKVKELKETGLQLRAIRVLLDNAEGDGAKAALTEQICEIGSWREENGQVCGAALSELSAQGSDNLRQFEDIMKRLIGEVVEERNRKLEEELREILREELERMYIQYGDAMEEAAASSEPYRERNGVSGSGVPEKRGIVGQLRKLLRGR